MRIFALVLCLTSVLARPEPGYSYNGVNPSQGLSVPAPLPLHSQIGQHDGLPQDGGATIGSHPSQDTHIDARYNEPQSKYGAPTSYESPPSGFNGDFGSPALSDLGAPTADYADAAAAAAYDSYNTAAYANNYDSSAAGGYAYVPSEPSIHKHIYVHVPPKEIEEDEDNTPHVHQQPAQRQKHYKIVFIKAPSAPAYRPPVIPPPQQNEEKTLIYVLHKKPERPEDIIIPTPAPTKPSKPEVYFIKYRTKKQEERPVYGPPQVQRSDDDNNGLYAGSEAVTSDEQSQYSAGGSVEQETPSALSFSPIVAAEPDNQATSFDAAAGEHVDAPPKKYLPAAGEEATIPSTAIPSVQYGAPSRYY